MNENQKRKLIKQAMLKQAGEVRFVKDDSNSPMNAGNWAWGGLPASSRTGVAEFDYNPDCSEDLANVLKSTLIALGHVLYAYNIFAKLKSRDISPDGNLGGRGYIQEVKHMRKQYMNCVEALSSMSDTLYDEIEAPHWSKLSRLPQKTMADIKEIKDDPEQWVEEKIEDDGGAVEDVGMESSSTQTLSKTARLLRKKGIR